MSCCTPGSGDCGSSSCRGCKVFGIIIALAAAVPAVISVIITVWAVIASFSGQFAPENLLLASFVTSVSVMVFAKLTKGMCPCTQKMAGACCTGASMEHKHQM